MTKQPLSPGQCLQHELEKRGMRNTQLAEALGRTPQYVTDIIKGKKALDVPLALQLERVLGGKPKATQWMTWAVEYTQAQTKLTRLQVLEDNDYAKEMIKLKWIDGNQSPEDLERDLKEFWSHLGKAANFKEGKRPPDEIARAAWAIEVFRRAEKQEIQATYQESKLPALIADLKKLMREEEDVAKVPEVLHRYGIRCVFLPHPPKCAVDGVASFNSGRPYIGMSLRIGRLDSFWFTLFHELMHIKNRDSESNDRVYVYPDTIDRLRDDPAEKRANAEARGAIITDDAYDAFVDEYDFSLLVIDSAAEEFGVHRSILLGRLKNDLHLDWSQFAREHPLIRHHLS